MKKTLTLTYTWYTERRKRSLNPFTSKYYRSWRLKFQISRTCVITVRQLLGQRSWWTHGPTLLSSLRQCSANVACNIVWNGHTGLRAHFIQRYSQYCKVFAGLYWREAEAIIPGYGPGAKAKFLRALPHDTLPSR